MNARSTAMGRQVLVCCAALGMVLAAGAAAAQDCDASKREFERANGAPVRDKDQVERAYLRLQAACGVTAQQEGSYAPPSPPPRGNGTGSGAAQVPPPCADGVQCSATDPGRVRGTDRRP